MKHDETDKIVFLTIIAGRKQKDALLTALLGAGIHLINTLYGKGTVKASYLQNTFGLTPEEKKVVITCVTTHVKSEAVMKLLAGQFNFNDPNTGVAFTIPIGRVAY